MVNSQTRFYVVPKTAIFNFKRLRKIIIRVKKQQKYLQFSTDHLSKIRPEDIVFITKKYSSHFYEVFASVLKIKTVLLQKINSTITKNYKWQLKPHLSKCFQGQIVVILLKKFVKV